MGGVLALGLQCDGPGRADLAGIGCLESVGGGGYREIEAARRHAARYGWRVVHGRDYCPECAEQLRGRGMLVGCYNVDLHCDNILADGRHHGALAPQRSRASYTGKNQAACVRHARQDGWLISSKRVLCPDCASKQKGRRG